ncbi:GNAT family N-acetyltransferase [Sutcliffiella cohnii]|uniref:GNAT family N-acetyltransferase n=1 Tax=Sutcliffiella cohnii TaxID=33932 RepID=UPI002E1E1D0D|nr:GNAT family N-acetyltransferase [Sutcliffiella cohnii]MED4016245.1 GNAT family N-acetyltransferase [Sutcliffiella cohnii]
MKLYKDDMNEFYAMEILSWQYEPPYDFYNGEVGREGMMELLVKDYYTILDENKQLVGFFCIGEGAQVPTTDYNYNNLFVDIGFGLKPDLTGQGSGDDFLSFIMEQAKRMGNCKNLRLTVASFNERAIHLYKKHKFTETTRFLFHGTEFIVMIQE